MSKRKPVVSGEKQGESAKQAAHLVRTDGTDDDIRTRCADSIPGWDKLGPEEQGDIVRGMKAFWKLPNPPKSQVTNEDGKISISPADSNVTGYITGLVETFGARSQELMDARLNDIINYHKRCNAQGLTNQNFNASLAFVRGAEPKDTVQSALAVQMDATHDAAMRSLSMIGSSNFVDHIQMYGNLANKLLNTYARQAETLAKIQRGGEQVVRHVHVDNRGGQAVITDQLVTGGANAKAGEQTHGAGSAAECAAMLGFDPQGNGMPVPGDAGEEAVPHPRRARNRRTKG